MSEQIPIFRDWLNIVLSKKINYKDDELYSFKKNKIEIKEALNNTHNYESYNDLKWYLKLKKSGVNKANFVEFLPENFLMIYLHQECFQLSSNVTFNFSPILQATSDLFFKYCEKYAPFDNMKINKDKEIELLKISKYIDANFEKIITKIISKFKSIHNLNLPYSSLTRNLPLKLH